MKDPQRLLEHGASEAELALLRAGAAEEPSAAARQRLLASLGVSGALASAALAQSAAAQAGTHSAVAGSSGGALKLVLAKLGVKGVALVLGSASLVGGGAWLATQLPPAHEAPGAAVHAKAAPRAVDRMAQSAPQAAAGASLAGEIALLDRARGLLRAGDARGAAHLLDQYAAQQPRGTLRQEAEVLRIDVHWQSGDVAQARRLSQAFLRAYAASPHAERVRARLAASESGSRADPRASTGVAR